MVQLGYFTIDTPDIEKARSFYGALFGWSFDEAASSPTYAHVADSDPAAEYDETLDKARALIEALGGTP